MSFKTSHIYDLAKAGLSVAEDIAREKPDVLIIPLIDGLVPYKIAIQALRKKLKISTFDYDPIVIFVPAGWEDYRKELSYRNEITNEIFESFLKKRDMYEKKGGFDKLMILDIINTGISLRYILSKTLDTLKKMAKEIYVSCISTDKPFFNRKLRELNVVDKYQKPGSIEKFFFHDADIEAFQIFDDEPSVIGYDIFKQYNNRLKKDEFVEKDGKEEIILIKSKRQTDFFPNLDHKNIEREPGISREFYLRLFNALENMP